MQAVPLASRLILYATKENTSQRCWFAGSEGTKAIRADTRSVCSALPIGRLGYQPVNTCTNRGTITVCFRRRTHCSGLLIRDHNRSIISRRFNQAPARSKNRAKERCTQIRKKPSRTFLSVFHPLSLGYGGLVRVNPWLKINSAFYQSQHGIERAFGLHELHGAVAGFDFHFAFGQGFFAEAYADGETDQVGVFEFYTRTFIAIV